ncbi:MAG TPA: NAD(P)-dependent oxidoreductase [Burkholderiaceae bacterium]
MADMQPSTPPGSRICLVTGGSGFLGINLVRHLLTRGWSVRTLDIEPFDYPERGRVTAILGDIRDPTAVATAMNGAETVVHCAAALPLASGHEIMSTGVLGTRTLLDAAFRLGVPRFVFISSTAVYGVPDQTPIREDHRLHGVGAYGRSKIDAEKLCEQARTQGLCVPLLRPKTFVGPERLGIFELLYDWAAQGRNFPVLGAGDNLYQLLDVRDLCTAIERCLTLPVDAVDDRFNVGASHYGTMAENIQCVLDRAGHGGRVVRIPAGPAVGLLRLLRALRLSPLYPWIYETAGHDSSVSIEKLGNTLGFTPAYSNADALRANFDWYLAHRSELGRRHGVTHRLPWRRGALSLAKAFF